MIKTMRVFPEGSGRLFDDMVRLGDIWLYVDWTCTCGKEHPWAINVCVRCGESRGI